MLLGARATAPHHGGIQPLAHAWSFKETPEAAPKQDLRRQPFLPGGCSRQSPSRADSRRLPAQEPHWLPLAPAAGWAPQPLTLLSSMCAASPDPPRCSPYTRSRQSRPPAAPADTAAHRGSGPPATAAITHRHVCLQPRGAVATAERCTLGSVVLFGPVAIGCRPDGDGKNYNSQQAQQKSGAAIGPRRSGELHFPRGHGRSPASPQQL